MRLLVIFTLSGPVFSLLIDFHHHRLVGNDIGCRKIKSIARQYGLFRTKTLICFPHSIPFPISQMSIFYQILVYKSVQSTPKYIFMPKFRFFVTFYKNYTFSTNFKRILSRKRIFPAILIDFWTKYGLQLCEISIKIFFHAQNRVSRKILHKQTLSTILRRVVCWKCRFSGILVPFGCKYGQNSAKSTSKHIFMLKFGFLVKFYIKDTLLDRLEVIKLDILPENFDFESFWSIFDQKLS